MRQVTYEALLKGRSREDSESRGKQRSLCSGGIESVSQTVGREEHGKIDPPGNDGPGVQTR